ncbi:MAG: hypothetical protein ABI811_05320 [Acidobacteriota bacterium]
MRLRTRLIAVFILATALPLGLTLWTSSRLLDLSQDLAPLNELRDVTQSLEVTGRELYQQARETLRRDAEEGRLASKTAAPAYWKRMRRRSSSARGRRETNCIITFARAARSWTIRVRCTFRCGNWSSRSPRLDGRWMSQ